MQRFLSIVLFVALASHQALAECAPGTVAGPCICTEDIQGLLVLECTKVTDGAEITKALEEIAVPAVDFLDIEDSPDLVTLPDNVFGTSAVHSLRIHRAGLASLPASAFSGPTSSVLTALYIKECPSFIVLEPTLVSALPALQQLYVSGTGIERLVEPLPENLLQYIDLSNNRIVQVHNDYFMATTNLTVVLLSFNDLTSDAFCCASQTFSTPRDDLYLDYGYNKLKLGLEDIVFPGAAPKELILSGNEMESLNQTNFAPLMAQMASEYTDSYILLDNNAFTCGCELEWLVSDPNRGILRNGLCVDGQVFENLGPEHFADCP